MPPVLAEMTERSAVGLQQLSDERDGTLTLTDAERAEALRVSMWACARPAIDNIAGCSSSPQGRDMPDKPTKLTADGGLVIGQWMWGLDVPERLLVEAYIMRRDISRTGEWQTGRESRACGDVSKPLGTRTCVSDVRSVNAFPCARCVACAVPPFMDLNLYATRNGSRPLAVIWQDDGEDPMNPVRLLVAHMEENGSVRPVASDLDAFLIGSKGMARAEATRAAQRCVSPHCAAPSLARAPTRVLSA